MGGNGARWTRVAATGLIGLLAVACGDDDDQTTDDTVERSTTTVAAVEGSAIAEAVEIGPGRELFLSCSGTGSPTVLLEAGDESGAAEWAVVQRQVAEETRTCAYDRAGIGRSTDAEGCRQIDDLLGDLDALITAAEIPGPYVFVGASGGGYLAAGIAERHAAEVAGLVLVETPKAIEEIPPEVAELIKCDHPANIEHRDYVAVEHAVWDDRSLIGDFPMVVITNDHGTTGVGDEITNVEDQRGWFVLSPQAEQVVVTSGHDVVADDPELVVQTILEVLAAARAAS
jgi:pimeloyl-ACP methyl ester carboxylesterase